MSPLEFTVTLLGISVIATSSGTAATYVRERLTNLRTTMLLELGTNTGAVLAVLLASFAPGRAM